MVPLCAKVFFFWQISQCFVAHFFGVRRNKCIELGRYYAVNSKDIQNTMGKKFTFARIFYSDKCKFKIPGKNMHKIAFFCPSFYWCPDWNLSTSDNIRQSILIAYKLLTELGFTLTSSVVVVGQSLSHVDRKQLCNIFIGCSRKKKILNIIAFKHGASLRKWVYFDSNWFIAFWSVFSFILIALHSRTFLQVSIDITYTFQRLICPGSFSRFFIRIFSKLNFGVYSSQHLMLLNMHLKVIVLS